ncbi:hypothetical protein [Allocatelliglobosispora scoriae]|uniref:hypothetical protein n=1 Tax=Allocatelliglobosispora scoriae TaxID=643052 RepID=UPI001617E217|nr:hypothetical protein [Allocatelliglobosispora scoriae]
MAFVLLAAGCSDHRDTTDPRDPDRVHVAAAQRGDRDAAKLTLVSGATTVTARAEDLGDDLYRISTPDNSQLTPDVVESGDRYEVHLTSTGNSGPAAVEILLNRDVRWDLRFAGGATETLVDMGAGHLSAVDFSAGSSRIETILPKPDGAVTVRMAGGASEFLVKAPQGIPVRVTAGGGAGSVTVDGVRRSGVAGGTVIAPAGWPESDPRYDVDAVAGVSSLTVSRT